MKTTLLTILTIAFMASGAFAGKENCFEKHVIANYVGGTGTFTTCNNTSSNYNAPSLCELKK